MFKNTLKLFVLFAFVVLVCLFTAGLAVKAAEETRNEPSVKTDIPMSTGETLVYSIKWEPPWYMFFLPNMEAGELTLRFQESAEFRGRPAVKVAAEARSSGTLTRLANLNIENEFLFYSSLETLCAEGSISTIREGKRMRRLELEYFQDERRLHFRAFDESVTPARLQRDIVNTNLPPCVYDPFTALYFYSTLPLTKGYAKNLVIGNDDKVLEVRTRIESQERVNTDAGRFAAWKISTNAMSGGLFSESGNFHLWVSDDERKMLVRFDVRVRFGRVIGTLKSFG